MLTDLIRPSTPVIGVMVASNSDFKKNGHESDYYNKLHRVKRNVIYNCGHGNLHIYLCDYNYF